MTVVVPVTLTNVHLYSPTSKRAVQIIVQYLEEWTMKLSLSWLVSSWQTMMKAGIKADIVNWDSEARMLYRIQYCK
jgi:hypothetical protein